MLCTSASIFHISVTAADDETVKVALEALKEGFSEGCTTQVIEWRYVLHGKIRRFSSTKNRKIEEAYGKMSPNVTVGLCGDQFQLHFRDNTEKGSLSGEQIKISRKVVWTSEGKGWSISSADDVFYKIFELFICR